MRERNMKIEETLIETCIQIDRERTDRREKRKNGKKVLGVRELLKYVRETEVETGKQ
jgi:hypothetical protein